MILNLTLAMGFTIFIFIVMAIAVDGIILIEVLFNFGTDDYCATAGSVITETLPETEFLLHSISPPSISQ